MIKWLSRAELESMSVPLPTMTRRDKLLRWAKLVKAADADLALFNGLEYQTKRWLNAATVYGTRTAFALAAADPIFQDAGLSKKATISECMKFFDLTKEQLHDFSCDCGGFITNEEMADRIKELA